MQKMKASVAPTSGVNRVAIRLSVYARPFSSLTGRRAIHTYQSGLGYSRMRRREITDTRIVLTRDRRWPDQHGSEDGQGRERKAAARQYAERCGESFTLRSMLEDGRKTVRAPVFAADTVMDEEKAFRIVLRLYGAQS
jgi:hypothetical protein